MLNNLFTFYFSFNGRATRYDFNIRYALVAFVGGIIVYGMDCIRIGGVMVDGRDLVISNIFSMLAFISGFAVTCRRLHDMDFSGWWQLPVHFISSGCIGILVATAGFAIFYNPLAAGLGGFFAMLGMLSLYLAYFIFLSAKRGTIGPNKYGPDLLQIEQTETIETIK
jgi:uncharacterized membrane protein YhaH (DUF805 family)